MRWRETLDDWHPMFCWQPYLVGGAWVWLERVERRRTLSHMWGNNFEYRLPALAAATGTAKTRNAAECEASQSGGSASERNAQPPSGDISND